MSNLRSCRPNPALAADSQPLQLKSSVGCYYHTQWSSAFGYLKKVFVCKQMDPLRHFAAVMTVVIALPLFLSWLLIHPLASVWRKFGGFTYFFVLFFFIGAAAGIAYIYDVHEDLLYFGTNYITVGLSVPCFIFAVIMACYYYRYLDFGILIGLPEITKHEYPGTLLTQGIYSKIRHPRYVGTYFFVLGLAFLANSPVPYIVAFILIPLIYIIVLFEERELHQRFGSAYEKYCQKVPRFIPKIF